MQLPDKLEFGPQGGQPGRAQDMCSRFCPAPLGNVLWFDKLEFAEVSAHPEQHCHSEPVRLSGVGISIDFQSAFRLTS